MEPESPRRRKPRVGVYLFLALTALGTALAYYRVGPQGPSSYEAIVRAGVGRDLLDGAPRGRQGLVGSLRWAPLPTLLALPLLRIPGLENGAFAASVVAAVGAALLCVFLTRWWAQYGMKEIILTPIAFALFLSPPLLRPILDGDSSPLFVFLVVATLAHLIHWWEAETPAGEGPGEPTDKTAKLRSLAYTAVAAGATVFVRYQGVVVLAVVTLIFAAHLIANRKREAYVEATLITLLLPGVYMVGLWFAANWLIMGDALFFVRGLRTFHGPRGWLEALTRGCEWRGCLAPALIGVLGWAICRMFKRRRTIWSGAPVLIACGALWLGGAQAVESRPMDPTSLQLRTEALPYLRSRLQDDRILVCGYRGYEIRANAPAADQLFVHELSMYMKRALQDTRGRHLYLLIPNPVIKDTGREDIDRWEDIILLHPRAYEQGFRGLLFEKSWDHWSLWRVVRLDAPDQPV